MDWQWLYTICSAEGQEGCIQPLQLAYLGVLVLGAVVLFYAGRRSRDLSTSVLALMPVAIAINIAVGALVVTLKLPIYLDSIGTVLVGVLAGPWAGALTGLLANLIWALLPVPGGAGPIIAFFAPVAAVIGLMAGFWGSRGVFQLRAEDARVGGFLALALGVAAAAVAFLVVQYTVGLPDISVEDQTQLLNNQTLFVTEALVILIFGAAVAWWSARSVLAFKDGDPRIRSYLSIATGLATWALIFFILRLLFSPTGYFSLWDGGPESPWPGVNLTGLAFADPVGVVTDVILAVIVGAVAWYWARRGNNHRARGGGDVGAHRGRRFRRRDRDGRGRPGGAVPHAWTRCLPVGLRTGPDQRPPRQDDQLHGRLPDPRLATDHRPNDVQPGGGNRRRLRLRSAR